MTSEKETGNILTEITEGLIRSDLDPVFALQLCLAWNDARCNPPLKHADVVRIVDGMAKRELSRLEGINDEKY